jgi:hypothetical protein
MKRILNNFIRKVPYILSDVLVSLLIISIVYSGFPIDYLFKTNFAPERANAASAQIRQEINILDNVLTAATSNVATSSEIINVDPTKYSGTSTFYFEVVVKGSTSFTNTITLRRSGGSADDCTLSGISLTTSYQLFRSSACTMPSTATDYVVRVSSSGSGSTDVKAGRVIVLQNFADVSTNATSTQTQIEIGSNTLATSSTLTTPLNSPKYWTYSSSKWDGSLGVYAEVTYKGTPILGATTTDTFSTAGSTSWTAGSLTTYADVACWGAGGAGFTGDANGGGGGGGGGAFASSTLSITPSTTYSITIGAGGTPGGSNGGNSTFNTSTIIAEGGKNGTTVTTGVGSGGLTTNSTGTTKRSGGNGGQGANGSGNNDQGGGGGGAGGPHGNGNVGSNASATVGGAGGTGDAASGGSSGSAGNGTGAAGNGGQGGTSTNGGGGGGGGDNSGTGGLGGSYGGGGGGGEGGAGSGADGACTVVYKPTTTYPVGIAIEEDNGNFSGWTFKKQIVNQGTSSVATRVRSDYFAPVDGRHYRIVASTTNSSGRYDIYNGKVIVDTFGTVTQLGDTFFLPDSSSNITMTPLSSTRAVVHISTLGSFTAYDFNGSTWTEVGSSFSTGVFNWVGLTNLSSTRIAAASDTQICTYDFNGSAWSLVGSCLTISSGGASKISALSSSRIAYINQTSGQLRAYDFNGSTWSLTSSLNVTGSLVNLASMSSTRVALMSSTQLRAYDFNGSTWSQIGNGLSIAGGGGLTALSLSRVANSNSSIGFTTYDFDNTNWTQSRNISDYLGSSMGALTSSKIAVVEGNDGILMAYDIEGTPYTTLEPQYLLANASTTSGTSLQNFLTKWDSSEWSGVTNTYLHAVGSKGGSSSVIELDTAAGVQLTGSSISSPNFYATSTSVTMPSNTNLDVKVTTNNNDIYASRILAQVSIDQPVVFYTVSGTIYTDEGTTQETTGGKTLKLVVGGDTIYSTTTVAGTGVWQINDITGMAAGEPITIYIDGDSSFRAVTVTKGSTANANITGVDLYKNRVIVRHEGLAAATSTKNTDLGAYDGDNDNDIQFTVDSSDPQDPILDVMSGQELHIWTGKKFDPIGHVELHGNAQAAPDGDLHIDDSSIFIAPIFDMAVAGNFSADTGSTFTASGVGIIYFTATTTGKTLSGTMTGSSAFTNIAFTPEYHDVGRTGSWTFLNNASTTSSSVFMQIDVGATVTAPPLLTIGSSFPFLSNAGTFINNGGTLYVGSSGTIQSDFTGNSALNKVVFTGGTNSFSKNASTSDITINSGATLSMERLLSVSGNFINNGTFTRKTVSSSVSTSTLYFSSTTGSQTISGTLTGNSRLATTTFLGGAEKIISSNASTTNFTIDSSSGEVKAPTLLEVSGNFINQGTFTHRSGTTLFTGSTTAQTISGNLTGTSALNNVLFQGSLGKTFGSNASTTNFTIKSSSGTITPSTLLSIGGNYLNDGTFSNSGGTVYFSSTSTAQTISGSLTSTSALGAIAFTGLGKKTFLSSASTTNITIASSTGDAGLMTSDLDLISGSLEEAIVIVNDSSAIYIGGWQSKGCPLANTSCWRVEKRKKDTGALIPSFGSGGVLIVDPTISTDTLTSVSIDNQYIYLIGNQSIGCTVGNTCWRVEKRDITTGALVEAFGSSGVVQSDPTSDIDSPQTIIVDNSYIYLLGDQATGGSCNLGALCWRVEKRDITTGALVEAFGSSGVVQIDPTSGADSPTSLVIDSSYIYLGGQQATGGGCSTGSSCWRVEKRDITTGALVEAFGSSGVLQNDPTSGADSLSSMAIDGSYIYLGGYQSTGGGCSTGSFCWRVEKRDITTGALVEAFGSSGVLQNDLTAGSDTLSTIAIDGSYIYLLGDQGVDGTCTIACSRYEKRDITTGALVEAFGTGGVARRSPSGSGLTFATTFDLSLDSSSIYASGYQDGCRPNSSNDECWRIEKLDRVTGQYDPLFKNQVQVTSPSTLLSVTGNFSNYGYLYGNGGTTLLSGTGQQTFSGTGELYFGNLKISNTSGTDAQSDPGVVFNSLVSATGTLTAILPNTKIQFKANATTTLNNLTLNGGASGTRVSLRSTSSGSQFGLAVSGTRLISYTDVKDSHACSIYSYIDASDGTNQNSGNNSCWTFVVGGSPTLSGAGNLTFEYGGLPSDLSVLTVTDAGTPTLTTSNGLRIAIATSSVNMRFDPSITTASFGGSASGKVTNSLSYEGGDSVVYIPVSSNFGASDVLTISGLKLMSFNAVNAAIAAFNILKDGITDIVADATDDKTVTIKGKETLADSSFGVTTNQFNSLSSGTNNLTSTPLYMFRITPAGENITVTNLVLNLSDIQGVSDSDITSVGLYIDYNSNGVVDANETQVGGAGSVSISGTTGTITFSSSFTATTTRDYIMRADVSNITQADSFAVRLMPSGITSSGVTSTVAITPSGIVNVVIHRNTGFIGGGNGSGGRRFAEIGGDPPAGQGVVSGGGSSGGNENGGGGNSGQGNTGGGGSSGGGEI